MKNVFERCFCNRYFLLSLAVLVSIWVWYARTTGVILGINDFEMYFSDSDDYMMLTRIRDFFHFGTTSYSLVNRVNVPNGADLYWTHLYDSILICLSWIVSCFTSSIDRAVELTGFFIAPIFRFLTGIVILKTFERVLPRAAFVLALIFCLHVGLHEISMLGRPDHHAFIMFLEVLYIYWMQRFIRDVSTENTALLALFTSLCVWASTETLPFVLICEVVLFFFGKDFTPSLFYKKNLLTAIFISLILLSKSPVSYCSALLLVSIYFFIKSPKSYFVHLPVLVLVFCINLTKHVWYDEISQMHLNLYVTACVYFASFDLMKLDAKRSKYGLLLGVLLGGVFLNFYPKFFLGIEGNASEFLRNYWFPTIIDLQPMLDHSAMAPKVIFWIFSLTLFTSIYDKCLRLSEKKAFGKDDLFWIVMMVLAVSYAVFTVVVCRMVCSLYMLGLPIIVEFCTARFGDRFGRWLAFFLTVVPTLAYYFIFFSKEGGWFRWDKLADLREHTFHDREFFRSLNEISEDPVVIMSDPYVAPKILYFSRHHVVVVPFHRQRKGLISSLIITQWPQFNERLSINELLKTNSTYMLIKRNDDSLNNLEGRISVGYIPQWISVQKVDKNREQAIVKIDVDLMKQSLAT